MAYIDMYQFIEKGTRSGVSYKVKKTMNTWNWMIKKSLHYM